MNTAVPVNWLASRANGNFRVPEPAEPLPFTGERMTNAAQGQIEFEHYHRYSFARDLCSGRDVLDVASGEGYGTALLSTVARSVVGVEIDAASVTHAAANYGAPNVRFLQGNALALPLPDACADIVVSFETLEHLADHERFIAEVRRVLRPQGLFMVSSPDRTVYSAAGSDPNPYHILELTSPEFRDFLGSHFANIQILAQRPVLGSLLAADDIGGWRSYERRSQNIIEATNGLARAHYLIGIASDEVLPAIGSSVYMDWRRVHDVVQDALSLQVAKDTAVLSADRSARLQAQLRAAATAERAAAAQEIAALQSRLHTAERARQRAAANGELAQRRLDALVYSTSWRLLAPLRLVGDRFPRFARLLRRSAKLAWWIVTLQLGSRVMQRRQRRAGARNAPAPPELPAPAPVRNPTAATPASKSADIRNAFQILNGNVAIHFPAVAVPEVSVIIPVYKGHADLENCLRSLVLTRLTEPTFEVILVDDCPTEAILWAVPDSGGLRKVSNTENLGFLLTCNKGASLARGRIVCFLNSDTIAFPGWLKSLVEALDDPPGAAIAGSMLLNNDGTIQEAGWRMLANGWGYPIGRNCDPLDGAYTYRRPVDCVSGACFAVGRQVFEELGGFDAAYAPAFYEEFDLAFRARERGLQVIYEPRSRVVHLGSASYGAERRDQLSGLHQAIFAERFASRLLKQPWDTSDPFVLRNGTEAGPIILVADYGVPQPDRHAGDVTMSRYLSLLAIAGWRVVFAPADGVAEGPPAEALERQGIELIRRPRTIEAWLTDHGRHVREVWLSRPGIADALISSVRAHTNAPITYYPHDLHHVRLQQQAELQGSSTLADEAARIREQEIAVFHSVDHIISPSKEEANLIRRLAPATPVSVLPPFFYESFEIVERPADHFGNLSDIVFVGGFPHTPNVDAALFIARDIMPIIWRAQPQARLVLVGYAPPPEVRALAGPAIVVTGQVPEIGPFLDRARVVLAALRFGAGVKGKIVDAMRLGVPVVTTPVGTEGIGIRPGQDALVASDAAGLAQHVLALFDSPESCAALSSAGVGLIRRRFSRAAARTGLAAVFKTLQCAICGSAELLPPGDNNFRESPVCHNCGALARAEAIGRVMLMRLAPEGEGSLAELTRRSLCRRVHEFGFVGGIAETLRDQPWFSFSEFFDDVQPGTPGPNNIPCEDLTSLTYLDDNFDMVISQDVMEHVPDPAAAFKEIARVLRPGGCHIFTVPQDRRLAKSVTRARLSPAGVEHMLSPEYHGDPVRSEGALVFTDFGNDLADILRRAGLTLVEHELTVLGGSAEQTVRVFEAIKQA